MQIFFAPCPIGIVSNFILRRLIGRRTDDPSVKKDMESWPFKVIDDGGNPKVQVEYLGSTHTFSPQEISAMVLTKVRTLLCAAVLSTETDNCLPYR